MLQKLVNASNDVNGMIILNMERFHNRTTDGLLTEKLYADGNLSTIEVHHLYQRKKKKTSKDLTDFMISG